MKRNRISIYYAKGMKNTKKMNGKFVENDSTVEHQNEMHPRKQLFSA